mmetsp:Transcript_6210/g.21297  ORF Transcript_6210/g.21297 Transcript_6210/m.21297 type:complete len:242 (+) Transcript_6210:606-1331(+)
MAPELSTSKILTSLSVYASCFRAKMEQKPRWSSCPSLSGVPSQKMWRSLSRVGSLHPRSAKKRNELRRRQSAFVFSTCRDEGRPGRLKLGSQTTDGYRPRRELGGGRRGGKCIGSQPSEACMQLGVSTTLTLPPSPLEPHPIFAAQMPGKPVPARISTLRSREVPHYKIVQYGSFSQAADNLLQTSGGWLPAGRCSSRGQGPAPPRASLDGPHANKQTTPNLNTISCWGLTPVDQVEPQQR